MDLSLGGVQFDELDTDLFGDRKDPVVAVKFTVADAFQPRVGDHFKARPARARGRIDRRAVDAHAVLGGLQDRIGLGVDRGHAMVVLHHMARLVAVFELPDAAVVTGREDRLVADDDGPDELAIAG